MLMSIKAPDGKHLFLSFNSSWNGQGYTIVFPEKYSLMAHDFVEFMPKYLQHTHGNAVLCWFTAEAVVEANNMVWDEDAQCLISQDGLSFKADFAKLDFEWYLSEPPATLVTLPALDLDNLSLPSFHTTSGTPSLTHLSGPVTITLARPSSTVATDSDEITIDSTIASHLSALENGWQKILHKLELLTTMGVPSPNHGSGSISILSGSPPGSALVSSGLRV